MYGRQLRTGLRLTIYVQMEDKEMEKSHRTIYITEEQFRKMFCEEDRSTTMAVPTGSTDTMANSINQSKQQTPSADNVMVDTSMFDQSQSNDPVQIDVTAQNGQQAQNKIHNMLNTNPALRTMSSNGKLMANVHMEGKAYSKEQVLKEQRLASLRKRASRSLNKEQIIREAENG